MRPRLLDLFSGAGGAGMGYYLAGFDVTGVDVAPQPRYMKGLGTFIQADALEYVAAHGSEYDAIHASPPCQSYNPAVSKWPGAKARPMLIGDVQELLDSSMRPYVIENVRGAKSHIPNAAMCCGLSFGLKVFRHRLFESNLLLLSPIHVPHGDRRLGKDGYCCPCGEGFYRRFSTENSDRVYDPATNRIAGWRAAMGIDWMIRREITQSIPPAYTEWFGRQVIASIGERIASDADCAATNEYIEGTHE